MENKQAIRTECGQCHKQVLREYLKKLLNQTLEAQEKLPGEDDVEVET